MKQFSFLKKLRACALPHWDRRIYSPFSCFPSFARHSFGPANKFAAPGKDSSPLTQNENCWMGSGLRSMALHAIEFADTYDITDHFCAHGGRWQRGSA